MDVARDRQDRPRDRQDRPRPKCIHTIAVNPQQEAHDSSMDSGVSSAASEALPEGAALEPVQERPLCKGIGNLEIVALHMLIYTQFS